MTVYNNNKVWLTTTTTTTMMMTLVYIANLKESQGNPYSYRVQVQIHRFTISIMVRFLLSYHIPKILGDV